MAGERLETVGIGLVLGGSLILRQIAVGRGQTVGPDLKDLATALFTGNMEGVREVTARRGQNLPDTTPSEGEDVSLGGKAVGGPIGGAIVANSTLATEMHRLAAAAGNRYVWGATGPNAYDCSGLVWRACVNLGLYHGGRFTTMTFPSIAPQFCIRDTKQTVGDIVVWPTRPGHMGVVVGKDTMYSALNHTIGIVTSPISATHGEPPQYWGLKPASGPAQGATSGLRPGGDK